MMAKGRCQQAEPVGPQADALDAGVCPAELDQDFALETQYLS